MGKEKRMPDLTHNDTQKGDLWDFYSFLQYLVSENGKHNRAITTINISRVRVLTAKVCIMFFFSLESMGRVILLFCEKKNATPSESVNIK